MKILLVEDERELAKTTHQFIINQGHQCDLAPTLSDALLMIESVYDLIILDLNLPDGNGLDVIKKVKSRGIASGIIVVSARNSIDNKVEGLELGADDYLTKPFHLSELNARIKSLVRRVQFQGEEEINYNELKVIPSQMITMVNGTIVDLTKKEFDLLIYLIANKNRILTKTAIGEHMSKDFGDYGFTDDFIYTHVKNLRKKLIKANCGDYIKNIYGVGYKFTDLD
jgi:DNA-binding response OmpR family regulator